MSVFLMAEAVLRSVSAAGQKGRKAWGVVWRSLIVRGLLEVLSLTIRDFLKRRTGYTTTSKE